MTSFLWLSKPIAILLLAMVLALWVSTPTYADHAQDAVELMKADRDAAKTNSAVFIITAVMLFAVSLVAAPFTGGASVAISSATLGGAIAAGATGVTYEMDKRRLDRKIQAWSSY